MGHQMQVGYEKIMIFFTNTLEMRQVGAIVTVEIQ